MRVDTIPSALQITMSVYFYKKKKKDYHINYVTSERFFVFCFVGDRLQGRGSRKTIEYFVTKEKGTIKNEKLIFI